MKNKKRIIINTIALAIIFAMQVGIFVYAKYVSTIDGSGNLSVAKWNISVNNETETIETISLGEKSYKGSSLIAERLAPGTEGVMELTLSTQNTDTAVDYKISFNNVQNKPTNLFFKYEDNNTAYYDLEELNNKMYGTIEPNSNKTVNIKWEWPYETGEGDQIETNDQIDTEEGKLAKPFTFDMVVKGLQSEPVE